MQVQISVNGHCRCQFLYAAGRFDADVTVEDRVARITVPGAVQKFLEQPEMRPRLLQRLRGYYPQLGELQVYTNGG
ncbi:MAG: hypothetical protein KDD69_06920 [Bdellovibrionales bacterium]|nr:hypothetical protein [Bdellovibrionales bacterium]